jgi:S-adenosylmethionine-diacylgycerolhomoserine-N-methlytransferase
LAHTGVPAGAHMDAIYRYQRHIYDASRKYYLLGRDRLLDELEPPTAGTVLEIACGTGRNLIKAARRHRTAAFYGFDISTAMLDTARVSIAREGLSDRIKVAQGDATAFCGAQMFGLPVFDRVFVSYALSMIPPWRDALQQAIGAVAPGGRLYVVDFGEQAGLPRWFKSGLRAWLTKFSVEPRDDLVAELQDSAAHPGFSVGCEELYRGYAIYAVVVKTAGGFNARSAI